VAVGGLGTVGTGAGATSGAGAGTFFLKKLNIVIGPALRYIILGSGALAQLVRATES
jgi:hypothetical protein